MSLFAIGDPHLSFSCDKPMDIFKGWDDYVSRLEKNWNSVVTENDTVVVPGDISWAMGLENAKKDFEFLNNLNTIGASGLVFGLLAAFGAMFPNSTIYLYFFLPLKTKWFVIGYIVLELFNGITTTSDGVAHFAHLGGAIAGLILLWIWKRKRDEYMY